MRLFVYVIIAVCFCLHTFVFASAAPSPQDQSDQRELQLLMLAQTPQELRETQKILRDKQIATQACAIQTQRNRLPTSCYARGRLEKQLNMQGMSSETDLLHQCLVAAQTTAEIEISLEMKKLLPAQCVQQALQTIKINRYKAGLKPL